MNMHISLSNLIGEGVNNVAEKMCLHLSILYTMYSSFLKANNSLSDGANFCNIQHNTITPHPFCRLTSPHLMGQTPEIYNTIQPLLILSVG